ncbi:MAG: RNA methyltransferase [Planctomycetes bacterium]|nr:RNA methyltransferase [Planctomycetota bacterium]
MNKARKAEEQLIYGYHAVKTMLKKRREETLRLFFREDRLETLKPYLSFLSKNKMVYRQVEDEELHKITKSRHHEGLCVFARKLAPKSLDDFIASFRDSRTIACALDGIRNDHNVGAIFRTAAFLGVEHALLTQEGFDSLSPSTFRTAEGALETTNIVACDDFLPKALAGLSEAGFSIVGTDAASGESLARVKFKFPAVLVLGSEQSGMGEDVRSLCETIVRIPGTSSVQSLNVSVASGIVLYEAFRQRSTQKRRTRVK